jgi:hypothetical protein
MPHIAVVISYEATTCHFQLSVNSIVATTLEDGVA